MTSTQFDGIDIVYALKPDELKIEGQLRGINIRTDAHVKTLLGLLDLERNKLRDVPTDPHPSADPEEEIEACEQLLEEVRSPTTLNMVINNTMLAKNTSIRGHHWYCRMERILKFGDSIRIMKLMESIGKLLKLINKHLNNSTQDFNQSITFNRRLKDSSWEDVEEFEDINESSVSENFYKQLDRLTEEFATGSLGEPGCLSTPIKSQLPEIHDWDLSNNKAGVAKGLPTSFKEFAIQHLEDAIVFASNTANLRSSNSDEEERNNPECGETFNNKDIREPTEIFQFHKQYEPEISTPPSHKRIQPAAMQEDKQPIKAVRKFKLIQNQVSEEKDPVTQVSLSPTGIRAAEPDYADQHLHRIENHEVEKQQPLNQDGIDQYILQPMMERQYNFLKKPFFKNLHFDGNEGSNIRDFIFKLETLSNKAGIDIQYVDSFILDYISGDALSLVWNLLRNNTKASWEEIKGSLISWFDGRDTDILLRRKLEERKQNETEPSIKFILEIMGMNSRLRKPFTEEELVRIIRENLHQAYRLALVTANITSINQLKKLCEECEHIWTTGFDYRSLGLKLSTNTTVFKNSMKEQGSDSVGHHNIRKSRKHAICWNCGVVGHGFSICTKPRTREFCFGCGKENVRKIKCFKCNKKIKRE